VRDARFLRQACLTQGLGGRLGPFDPGRVGTELVDRPRIGCLHDGDPLVAPTGIKPVEGLPVTAADFRDGTVEVASNAGHLAVLALHVLAHERLVPTVCDIRQDHVLAAQPLGLVEPGVQLLEGVEPELDRLVGLRL